MIHIRHALKCSPIERLLPPRFLRGEKVAKPDEGALQAVKHVLCERDPIERRPCPALCTVDATAKSPLIRLRHLLPH